MISQFVFCGIDNQFVHLLTCHSLIEFAQEDLFNHASASMRLPHLLVALQSLPRELH